MPNVALLPSGPQLIDGDVITGLWQNRLNQSTDGLTAHSGGAKAGATQLSNGINHVTVSAADLDSVLLPIADGKSIVFLVNGSATHSIQVFGQGTDTINDIATATGVTQNSAKSACYVSPILGKWYRILSA